MLNHVFWNGPDFMYTPSDNECARGKMAGQFQFVKSGRCRYNRLITLLHYNWDI